MTSDSRAFRLLSSPSDDKIAAFATALVATSLCLWPFPALDLLVSGWFYRFGDGFPLSSDPTLRLLRSSSTWVLSAVVLIAAIGIVREGARARLRELRAERLVWLLCGLALGAGLIVNGLLKAYWGRPRPIAIEASGGEAVHQNAWVISDWCDRNCSFVSGEASLTAWLVAAALVTPRTIRPWAVGLAVIYAGALSLNRIAFGEHFLSDVVLAWLICGLVFAALFRALVDRRALSRRSWTSTQPTAEPQH